MKKALLVAPVLALVMSGCSMQTSEMTPSPSPESAMMNQTEQTGTDTSMGMNEGVMVGGALMTPDKDIVANAMNANNVTTVVAAVKAADLVATLQGPGPFTVFAPSNDAFNKLPAGTVDTLLKPENKAKLQNILKYHVVPGKYTSADLKSGMTLKTVQGENLTVTEKDGMWMVNGTAMVETADVISSNGVTFVIDTVLMPKK